MFSNVLKKFFTNRAPYENKRATKDEEVAMLNQIKITMHRSRDTLLIDALGALSLVVMLVAALHL